MNAFFAVVIFNDVFDGVFITGVVGRHWQHGFEQAGPVAGDFVDHAAGTSCRHPIGQV